MIVEDDADLRELVAVTLASSGYRTVAVADGESAVEQFHAKAPDLVLLDISLGNASIDGLEVCRRLRRDSDAPIIFLTTHGEDIDQIIGFSTGADDYLTKPVNHRILLARIAAILRRRDAGARDAGPTTLTHEAMTIDLASRTVSIDDRPVDLTRIQFDLLASLAEQPRRVLTREQLVDRVWGGWYGTDHHLDVHLSRLRQRITQAGGPRVAHSVRGVGFRFTA